MLKWLSAGGFLAFLLWVILMANRGEASVWFELVGAVPYGDKLGHLVLYGTLALLMNWALGWRALSRSEWLQWGSLSVALFALAEELTQGFLPRRTLDGWDLMADGVGLVLATAVSVWLKRRLSAPAPGSVPR
ncbi:VanZ family protein [Ferrimonas balearica]|uniref:VanZ family protein n=1 Tax=Ferrimonas balearica TaxID=44012 RepID=UPI001C99BDAB|nr:VanZ family protein [Ferrimonas balearica]MBY5991512.1 VanZ family protein [Ferrimonas balearica]